MKKTNAIPFERFCLSNGLRVVVNPDSSSPLVAMSICYDVGSKDEAPERTGFAHLFEHLMFGGSVNIADFDTPMQLAGGENNAFTTQDITCYHCILPAENIETAFWLESDRMLSLAFTPESLEVQRKVVIEEFKQRYLNAPYGDLSHLLYGMAYMTHPYRWPTIGLVPEHVEHATLEEVRAFFGAHYMPSNAVLALSGRITPDEAERLCERWFGPIAHGTKAARDLPIEPPQTSERRMVVERNVPNDVIVMAFHMCGRLDADYSTWDMLSDILSNGRSARLPLRLVEERGLLAEVNASVSGNTEAGLLMVSGVLHEGVSLEEAESALWEELEAAGEIEEAELRKVQEQFAATATYETISIENRAQLLSEFETLGNATLLEQRVGLRRAVTCEAIREVVARRIRRENCMVIHYKRRS